MRINIIDDNIVLHCLCGTKCPRQLFIVNHRIELDGTCAANTTTCTVGNIVVSVNNNTEETQTIQNVIFRRWVSASTIMSRSIVTTFCFVLLEMGPLQLMFLCRVKELYVWSRLPLLFLLLQQPSLSISCCQGY